MINREMVPSTIPGSEFNSATILCGPVPVRVALAGFDAVHIPLPLPVDPAAPAGRPPLPLPAVPAATPTAPAVATLPAGLPAVFEAAAPAVVPTPGLVPAAPVPLGGDT